MMFVSFPGVVGGDGTPLIAWAGLDHLQLAKAIGDFYGLVQTELGGSDDPRLMPLLAGLYELVPWIRQWHAGASPLYGGEPAAFFADFLRSEAAAMGTTVADLLTWEPPQENPHPTRQESQQTSRHEAHHLTTACGPQPTGMPHALHTKGYDQRRSTRLSVGTQNRPVIHRENPLSPAGGGGYA